jgi:hypothetical protein
MMMFPRVMTLLAATGALAFEPPPTMRTPHAPSTIRLAATATIGAGLNALSGPAHAAIAEPSVHGMLATTAPNALFVATLAATFAVSNSADSVVMPAWWPSLGAPHAPDPQPALEWGALPPRHEVIDHDDACFVVTAKDGGVYTVCSQVGAWFKGDGPCQPDAELSAYYGRPLFLCAD